jgi:transcriptional regulator with XRE-family HTH domain
MANYLGDKIKICRQKKGFTLDKLANLASISKSYLWELENRESQRPSAEKLAAIADALDVTTSYFLVNDNRAPKEKDIDDAFFRGYRNLESKDKEQLRKILDAFKKE